MSHDMPTNAATPTMEWPGLIASPTRWQPRDLEVQNSLVSASQLRNLEQVVGDYLRRALSIQSDLAIDQAKHVVEAAMKTASSRPEWEYRELQKIALRIAVEQVATVYRSKQRRIVPTPTPAVMVRAAKVRRAAPLRGSWWTRLLKLNLRVSLKPSAGESR